MSSPTSARGQILIVAAATMVVLMAVGAIVVDLGLSWMLHRQEQNAADPGSIAAARWIRDIPPSGTKMQAMEAEACFYAQQNGFFVGDTGCAAALASGDLDVNWPPSTDLAGEYQGRTGFVEVVIRDTHPSFFGQIIGYPFATVRTGAVAALTNGQSNSSSLVALGEDCTNANDDNGASAISGGGTVRIFPATGVTDPGGYVHVNASCGLTDDVCQNGSGQSALAISGNLSAPFTNVVGGCTFQGSGPAQPECSIPAITPCLDEGATPLGDPLAGLTEPWPYLTLPAPPCPDPTDVNDPSDGDPCELSKNTCPDMGVAWVCTMSPGVYYAGWDIKSGTPTEKLRVVFEPGMYVFAGGGITPGPNTTLDTATGIDGSGNLIDARVTVFSTDGPNCPTMQKQCQGPITITSTSALRMKATNITTCQQVSPQICPWTGILFWMDGSVIRTPQDIRIEGQGDLVLSGTIYAPESHVEIAGGANGSGCAVVTGQTLTCLAIQIIAESWTITGGGTLDMPYNPDELYQLDQRGLVH